MVDASTARHEVPGPGPDRRETGAYADALDWARDLMANLDSLDPVQSRAVRLIYFQRCTQEQVAAQLSISLSAVAAQLADAMRSLALAMA